MSEIKFRAWLSDTQKRTNEGMIYSDELGIIKFFENFYRWTGDIREIMQYTGVKDRNGKEIYEGDIVKFYMGGVGFAKGVVILHNFCWAIKKGDAILNFDYFGNNLKNIEVIGNIHDNPELIKEVSEN